MSIDSVDYDFLCISIKIVIEFQGGDEIFSGKLENTDRVCGGLNLKKFEKEVLEYQRVRV